MENWKILVVDESNEGVLSAPASLDIAIHISSGFINSRVTAIPLHREHFKKFSSFDFEADLIAVTLYRSVSHLPIERITPEFLSLRSLAKARLKALESLKTYCYLGRISSSFGFTNEIAAEVDLEIIRCRPEDNFFTSSIIEYAHLQEMSPAEAFSELKMKIEGARLIKIRNFAVFDKYARLINQSDESHLESYVEQALDRVFMNSMV